jgi:Lon protease-like protein
VLGILNYPEWSLKLLINSLNERQQWEYELKKADWEQARMVAQSVIAVASVKEQGKKELMRKLSFPWDNEQGTTGLTKEQMQEMQRISDTYHGRNI